MAPPLSAIHEDKEAPAARYVAGWHGPDQLEVCGDFVKGM